MTDIMDKFSSKLLYYYKEVVAQLNFLKILKNFTSSMDIKDLYPLLDYPENNNFLDKEFSSLITDGKNLIEKGNYEFSEYDNILSTILKNNVFEHLDKRYYELSDIKDDFDNGCLDYSFITKFMMKCKFSISEINIVLSNYKPNKRKPVENNFDASLSKVELSKRDNKIKNDFIHNEKYFLIITFLKNNENFYKDYLIRDEVINTLSLSNNYLNIDNSLYPEIDFITLLIKLYTLERKFDLMINSNVSTYENANALLENMFELYLKCKNYLPEDNLYKLPNEVINLSGINIPVELINKLKMGNFDYKKGIEPLKINISSEYIIRVNTEFNNALTFIEHNNNIYILVYGNKNDIIDLTFDYINKNKKLIDNAIYGETNERKK